MYEIKIYVLLLYNSYLDGEKNQHVVSRFQGKEEVFVDSVRLCGDFQSKPKRKACIMLRIQVYCFIVTDRMYY